jgi:signal transduction histidine kinase/CheY-like chemotaxis protein
MNYLLLIIIETLLVAAFVGGFLFLRRRLAARSRALRTLCMLDESLVGTAMPREILRKLTVALPDALGVTGARLYLYNRRTRQLDEVAADANAAPVAVNPETPAGQPAAGVALAFRNRTLLAIPDSRRTPLLPEEPAGPPRAVLFVPMSTRNDVVGILEIEHLGAVRRFTAEEQTVAQHLANQIAATLRLFEQRSIQEQLFRSEKLAAAGQVISGVAEELVAPLEAIRERAEGMLAPSRDLPSHAALEEILAESRRAADIVTRLGQFANVEAAEIRQVDLNELVGSLMAGREQTWETLGLVARDLRAEEPVAVLGSPGQLKQVLTTLSSVAEKWAAHSPARTISISTKVLARRALVEIGFGSAPSSDDSEIQGLAVIRGMIRNHGGELRFHRHHPAEARFEVDLPAATGPVEEVVEGKTELGLIARTLTTLLVEPDEPARRQLLLLLSQRGHRVVPVASAEEALDLAGRFHFDLVGCSLALPGLNWVEFFQNIHHQTGAFILLTEGFDPELAHTFRAGEGYLLTKPVQTGEFDRVLSAIETKLAGAA